MRRRPSTPTLGRFAAMDFDYQGLHIAKDTFLAMCVTPAQRDPRVYGESATFDITATRGVSETIEGAGMTYTLLPRQGRVSDGDTVTGRALRVRAG